MELHKKISKLIAPAKDLGFGTKDTQHGSRFINKNGTFNVRRTGLPLWQSFSIYHFLLTISWPQFILIVIVAYAVTNLVFAGLYLLAGFDGLNGMVTESFAGKFWEAFFFSAQTFTTVGYGRINPVGMPANIIASIESLSGLLAFAIATGVLYGRFARPNANIVFSENALVGPYQNITAFMFRIANARNNQLIDVEVQVSLSLIEEVNGVASRKYYELPLERAKIEFFSLSWTVVHPIDESSPLYTYNHEKLERSDAEFLILIKAFDDTFSQNVHTRSSYKYDEVKWNHKFVSIFKRVDSTGSTVLELGRINEMEKL